MPALTALTNAIEKHRADAELHDENGYHGRNRGRRRRVVARIKTIMGK
jgi:ribosomal protein S6E (S10)